MTDHIIARSNGGGTTTAPTPKPSNGKQPFSAGPHISGLDAEPARKPGEGFVTKDGEYIGYNADDPASLGAWFGNFGYAEHFRKVVLASCREAARARASLIAEKSPGAKMPSEAKLDDVARTSDRYVDWLIYTLAGRKLWENNVLTSGDR